MCGITGIVAQDARAYGEPLQRMVDALAHRGPDGSGTLFLDGCALGHTRLSIVDLTGGAQPMLSAGGRTGLTFNGEIFGYRDLRAELADYPFRTTSDTEVILALYERFGAGLLDRLPGQFAFAIWDEERQELLAARDRFGEKPLYYAWGRHGEFLFASEIKALLASGLIEPVLSRASVGHYLRRLYVHPSRTIYENIHTLPPAHALRYRAGRVTVERYWDLPLVEADLSLDQAADQFQHLLARAVELQLVADVPVGAFLSGGLDSSTVVALASRAQKKLRTFSFGFDGDTSELPFARLVAQQYGTDHVELEAHDQDIAALLVRMQDVYDEPFGDSSNIPTYLLCQQARRHLKVVLTGDGADELVAGYSEWYKPLLFMQRETNPAWWRLAMLRVAARIARGHPRLASWRHRHLGATYRRRYRSLRSAHRGEGAFFDAAELEALGFASNPEENEPSEAGADTLDEVLREDVQDYMPGDILVKIDRASMAHGLELRAPYLDVAFASFCLSLPYRLKTDTHTDKLILRRAFASAWPAPLRARGKQGFGAPLARWLSRPAVRALKNDVLLNPRSHIYHLMPRDRCLAAVQADDHRTWALLNLALWLDRHLVAPGRGHNAAEEMPATPAWALAAGQR
jgi:asparagine synthase (glutamine-hydrolysing)